MTRWRDRDIFAACNSRKHQNITSELKDVLQQIWTTLLQIYIAEGTKSLLPTLPK